MDEDGWEWVFNHARNMPVPTLSWEHKIGQPATISALGPETGKHYIGVYREKEGDMARFTGNNMVVSFGGQELTGDVVSFEVNESNPYYMSESSDGEQMSAPLPREMTVTATLYDGTWSTISAADLEMDNLGLDLSEVLDDMEVNNMKKIVYRLWAVNRESGDIYEGDVFSGDMDNDVALQGAILDNAEAIRELGDSEVVEVWLQALRGYTVAESEQTVKRYHITYQDGTTEEGEFSRIPDGCEERWWSELTYKECNRYSGEGIIFVKSDQPSAYKPVPGDFTGMLRMPRGSLRDYKESNVVGETGPEMFIPNRQNQIKIYDYYHKYKESENMKTLYNLYAVNRRTHVFLHKQVISLDNKSKALNEVLLEHASEIKTVLGDPKDCVFALDPIMDFEPITDENEK